MVKVKLFEARLFRIVLGVLNSALTADFLGIRWASVLFVQVLHVQMNVPHLLVCFLACGKKLHWTVCEFLSTVHGNHTKGEGCGGKAGNLEVGFSLTSITCRIYMYFLMSVALNL